MRALIFETVTGEAVVEVEPSAWGYDGGILATTKTHVTIPGYTARAQSMDMRELLKSRKYSIALVDGSIEGARTVPAAGTIEAPVSEQGDDGKDRWTVECHGPQMVIGTGARIRKFPGWPMIDAVTRKPNGTYDLTVAGVEYGTLMKRILQEAAKFPGGQLPLNFEPDRPGTRTRTYAAIDGKPVIEALDDLADLIDGVEYDFRPRIAADDSVSFDFVTATDAARFLTGPASGQVWNLGGESQDVRGWRRAWSQSAAVTDAYFTGGKDDDAVLIARASSSALVNDGFPRKEIWDSSHSSVSILSTLQSWADGALGEAVETAALEVRVDVAGLVTYGDVVEIAAAGHWDMPDGETSWRVLSVGRKSESPDWYQVNLVR